MMKKKKLVALFVLFATAVVFSQTSAQARGHHIKRAHYAAHHGATRIHAASSHRRYRHHASRHHRYGHHAHRFAHHGARAVSTRAGRPRAWCGWWLGRKLGMPHRGLWQARNWASVGRNAGGPGIGVVVVWRHHVGIITGRAGSQWIIQSGNDRNAVRERPRSIAGAIAFRHVGGSAPI
jgi:hypothetical protein